MESFDSVRINFSEDQLVLLNICLAFLMFGISLDIRLADFRQVLRTPKAPLVGLSSEYLLLPLLTLALIYLLQPAPSLALGMLLIAVCPGGSVSNFMVHSARGNVALSVMLTSVTTLGAIVITPLAFAFWMQFVELPEALRASVHVEPAQMLRTIVQLVLVPVSLGMFFAARFPALVLKVRRPIAWLSILIFLGFVVFAIAGNYEFIRKYLFLVFWLVLLHNGLSLLMGYRFARVLGQNEANSRAISIETGIQNSGLGLILVFNFFDGLGGMAILLAWWGVWHLISGMLLAAWWRSRPL